MKKIYPLDPKSFNKKSRWYRKNKKCFFYLHVFKTYKEYLKYYKKEGKNSAAICAIDRTIMTINELGRCKTFRPFKGRVGELGFYGKHFNEAKIYHECIHASFHLLREIDTSWNIEQTDFSEFIAQCSGYMAEQIIQSKTYALRS